jgi:hypothetical protein
MATRKSKGKNIFGFVFCRSVPAYNLATFCCRAFRRSSAARWPVAIAPWIVAAALGLVASPPKKILRPMGYTFAGGKVRFHRELKGHLEVQGESTLAKASRHPLPPTEGAEYEPRT